MTASSPVSILGPDGLALPPSRPTKARALSGNNSSMPWDAADQESAETANWLPFLNSADGETNIWRDRIVSRVRDLVRNDGWAAGGITRITDAVVGADLRLASTPDYRALARAYGPAFDATWAKEFSSAAEAAWRTWAYDRVGRWCDASRRHTFPEIARLAFRHLIVDGDALAVPLWRPNRVGTGRARYSTTLQLIDPDRLSNPQNRMDTLFLRGGCEVDEDGATIAYHIRRAHMGDWFAAAQAVQWERVDRESDWGRPSCIHWFEADRAGQHRGNGGVLRPVLARAKMLARYDQTELQAAVVNATFAAFIESPNDPELVQDALDPNAGLPAYQQMRSEFHADKRLQLNGVRMPTLFPGEKINTVAAARPSGNFPAFQSAMLRNLASAAGLSYEQLTQDWSQTNYSSARAALLETWKTLSRRRTQFAHGFCTPVWTCLLEEAFDLGELPLPRRAPDFMEARQEYSACRWTGPGRGWVDPVKEAEGALMRVAGGLSTLEDEAAENTGKDIEEILDQRQAEVAMFRERGLPLPESLTGAPKPAAARPQPQPQDAADG